MECAHTIANHLSDLKLFSKSQTPAEEQIAEFEQQWKALGKQILEMKLQQTIQSIENGRPHSHRKRTHRYYTPFGVIHLTRRFYRSEAGPICWADDILKLPSTGWFASVQELASGLGVSSEFPNATRLFQRWSGIDLSEKSLANQVEACGEVLEQLNRTQEVPPVTPITSSVSEAAQPTPAKPVVYVGADGIHTPMKGPQSTLEAKVGVIFWQSDHWQISHNRSLIRAREYVATLESVHQFRTQLNQHYAQEVGEAPHQVVFLGDGAPWIWAMAALLFPKAIEILDFYHVSEYVWQVARQAWPTDQQRQDEWVEQQKTALKQSQWRTVLADVARLPPTSEGLSDAVRALESYLRNNQTRIDYQRYRQLGLMIGSGVVESSNRRIVTQRLKQSGMFWSKRGAQAVMTLRAAYLSDSERWQNFWQLMANQ